MQPDPSAAISVDNVSVVFGETTALAGVTFSLSAGTICALIGVNGSGKSTLFRAILGLQKLTAGTVSLAGHSVHSARKASMISYVPQSEDIDRDFPVSVRDVVEMGRYRTAGLTSRLTAVDREIVSEAIERVGLTDLSHRQIGQLSGGQRKRVFVARMIAQRSRVMLLDEPFTGIDAASESLIISVLKERARDGATILISTHSLVSLPNLANSGIVLHRKIMAAGPISEITTPEILSEIFGMTDRGSAS